MKLMGRQIITFNTSNQSLKSDKTLCNQKWLQKFGFHEIIQLSNAIFLHQISPGYSLLLLLTYLGSSVMYLFPTKTTTIKGNIFDTR